MCRSAGQTEQHEADERPGRSIVVAHIAEQQEHQPACDGRDHEAKRSRR